MHCENRLQRIASVTPSNKVFDHQTLTRGGLQLWLIIYKPHVIEKIVPGFVCIQKMSCLKMVKMPISHDL